MTISSSVRLAGPFPGNDSATDFPFTFKVFKKNDVQVTLTDTDGNESILTLDSDYSVTLNANQNSSPGGSVTYPLSGAPLATGFKLTLSGSLPYEQPTGLTNQGGFYPQVVEDALDRCVIQIQQLAEQLSRAFRAPISGGADIEELLRQLEAQLVLVTAVYNQLDDIETVATIESDVSTTAANAGAVVTVAGDLGGTWRTGVTYDFGQVSDPPTGNVSPPGGNIVVVSNNIANVNTAAGNIGDVNTVSQSIADVNLIAGNFPTIQAVNANAANIDAAVANETDIDTVAANILGVNTVSGSIANVNTVAADIADVDTVAGIAPHVTTVAGSDTQVVALGNDLTGQPIVIDYGSVTAPAANPAAPSGVLGAVWTNATNIAAVAGEIAAVVYVSQNLQAILDALVGALRPSNNLSDLTDPAAARANLGLADLGSIT